MRMRPIAPCLPLLPRLYFYRPAGATRRPRSPSIPVPRDRRALPPPAHVPRQHPSEKLASASIPDPCRRRQRGPPAAGCFSQLGRRRPWTTTPPRLRRLRTSDWFCAYYCARMSDIQVQHLIEKCICYKLNKEECMETLEKHAKIMPVVTSTVWKELEKENREFFETYKKDRGGGGGGPRNLQEAAAAGHHPPPRLQVQQSCCSQEPALEQKKHPPSDGVQEHNRVVVEKEKRKQDPPSASASADGQEQRVVEKKEKRKDPPSDGQERRVMAKENSRKDPSASSKRSDKDND
uniref:Uncharacterized protein n=1 Tax=Zea mays TaxID=4577 RepID=A0A804NB82_MAIZE